MEHGSVDPKDRPLTGPCRFSPMFYVLLLLLIAFALYSIYTAYTALLQRLQHHADRAARSVSTALTSRERTLAFLAHELHAGNAVAHPEFAARLLRRYHSANPHAIVFLLDHKGNVIASSTANLSGAGQHEFRHPIPARTFSLDPVRYDLILHRRVIPLYYPELSGSRPLFILSAPTPVAQAAPFWHPRVMDGTHHIGLLRTDDDRLELLWPHPRVKNYMMPVRGALVRALAQSGDPSGTFSGATSGTIDRIGAYRRLPGLPLVAFVSAPALTLVTLWWASFEVPFLLLLALGVTDCIGYRRLLRNFQSREREHAQTIHRLTTITRRAKAARDVVNDGVIMVDATGHIDYLNATAERLTGWSAENAGSRALAEVYVLTDEHGGRLATPSLTNVHNGRVPEVATLVSRLGDTVQIEQSVVALRGTDSAPEGMVIAFQDITEKKTLAQRLAYETSHDLLTGLPNRSWFRGRLADRTAHASPFAVLLVNIRGLRRINGAYGRETGDAALRSVADQLRRFAQAGVVARYGGDEFALIALGAAEERARTLGEAILAIFDKPVLESPAEIYVAATVGIALFPTHDSGVDGLCDAADKALLDATRRGPRSMRFFKANGADERRWHLSLDSALRHALARNEFRLRYQPEVDLRSGEIVAVEALLRWHHPDMGRIPPEQFIPLAEQNNLIASIGEWVLNTACLQAAAWHRAIGPIVLGVNMSAQQCEGGATRMIDAALRSSSLPPRALQLEITESVLIRGDAQTLAMINACKDLGVSLAIDDFGTGYSSLSYLKYLPADTLKLDATFMAGVPSQPRDNKVLRAMITIGHSLGLRITAEGVETSAQLAFARQVECDMAQGLIIGTPMAPEAFGTYLQNRIPRAPGG